ncbi:MAG: IS110 family transposase [Mesorhizobium sp.]|uniref:IS110 family transposase n=1 Tax=Mesorhizobium sp. TaxID=1871066 RepID=UPI000FEA9625|nr:IS110 family transposase [Mesorhizobium sp.]RWF80354.1 MAG: IS110 family transposase [Mesorhizobium sp.]TJW49762.1 MAG: IS110 family transposase [Mesorhizobium sp.]
MSQSFDTSRSLTALEQDNTIIAVIEMSKAKWLVAALVPGLKRQPLKKIDADAPALLKLLQRWRDEAGRAGHTIKRIAVAYEAAGDGFWLARWLRAHGIDAYAIHPSSVPVSREHRRAKTDRLDTELLMRAFLGWLRGEKRHCSMAAIPTLEEEDARRPNRERGTLVGEQTRLINRVKAILARFGVRSFRLSLRQAADRLESIRTAEGTPLPDNTRAELYRFLERLNLVRAQIRAIEQERLRRLAAAPAAANGHAMVRLLARIIGIGVETADMLVHEILSRPLRDRRAVARYAGLTGSPDESGQRRREKGLARAGNARVRRGMIQLAWRFFLFQKDSDLAQWFQARTSDGRKTTRKTMIMALARKLLIALWRFVTAGEVPQGVIVRAA